MEKIIYLDNAATTPADEAVTKIISKALKDFYGNPSSIHSVGREAKNKLILARKGFSEILNCKPKEVVFTSGGTESNNLALIGFALKNKVKGNHIVSTNIEHSSVLEPLKWLEKNGFEVTYVPTEKDGFVDVNKLKKAIKKNTILVSVIYANNEIGTIQPVKEVAAICREKKIAFHTDACQAGCSLSVDVEDLGVDMMTLNGSKIYGPKGVGLLYVRQGTELEALIHGGEQEFALRGGTENLPLVLGFLEAFKTARKRLKTDTKKILALRDKIIKTILSKVAGVRLNGDQKNRLANNINFTFEGIEADTLMARLDMQGICVSAGSACASGSVKPSHVILALGVPYEKAHGTIRISLGKQNTSSEVERFLKIIQKEISELRKLSPFF